MLNINGYDSIDTVMKRGLKPLNVSDFESIANETDALILDTRDPEVFAHGFIPNSINIGIDGNFAMWAGALIPGVKHPILLVTDDTRETEAVTRLARVGYDHVLGYLKGGYTSWKNSSKEVDTANRISAFELEEKMPSNPIIIDIRNESEFEAEHIIGAMNVPLDYINYNLSSFPKDKPFFIHCAGGYRSMIAASILKARGWENFADVKGGFKAISEVAIPKSVFVCPNKIA